MTDERHHEPLQSLDAYWRAANFLSVGQIFLWDNPHGQDMPEIRNWRWRPAP